MSPQLQSVLFSLLVPDSLEDSPEDGSCKPDSEAALCGGAKEVYERLLPGGQT